MKSQSILLDKGFLLIFSENSWNFHHLVSVVKNGDDYWIFLAWHQLPLKRLQNVSPKCWLCELCPVCGTKQRSSKNSKSRNNLPWSPSQRRWYEVWGGGDKSRLLEASAGVGTALEMLQRGKEGQLQVRLKSTNGSRAISSWTQHLTCFLETEIMAVREWSWHRQKDGWTCTELCHEPLLTRKGQAPVTAYECLSFLLTYLPIKVWRNFKPPRRIITQRNCFWGSTWCGGGQKPQTQVDFSLYWCSNINFFLS